LERAICGGQNGDQWGFDWVIDGFHLLADGTALYILANCVIEAWPPVMTRYERGGFEVSRMAGGR
jgi:hypothetical protein